MPDNWIDNGGNAGEPEEENYDESLHKPIWWYHTDHLGSSTYLTDNFGRPSHYYDQLPFGESMVEHNQSRYYGNQYKFNGKELDSTTGMYYYGARYYEPRFSIFVSLDPATEEYRDIGGYVYVANNPINAIDPDGRRIIYIIRGNAKQQSSSFYYKNGNFYNPKNNKLFIPDEKKHATMYKVWKSYQKIESSNDDILKGQLKTIENSNNLHYIEHSPNQKSAVEALGDIRNSEGKITNSTQGEFYFNSNSELTPFEIVVHELRHQFDYDIGNSQDAIKKGKEKDPMEIRAVINQNRARKILGKEPLDNYGGKKIDSKKLKNPPNNVQPRKYE